jgi:hypothetical protein
MNMLWIQNRDTWESGPYVIELLGPKRWVLTRLDDAKSEGTLVRTDHGSTFDRPLSTDNGWTGTSLSEMKATAEKIEQRQIEAQMMRRSLTLLFGAILVFLGAVGAGTGQLSTVVAIGATGVFIFALSRVIDRMRNRPLEYVSKVYQ